jgi:hypothetical protein
MRLRRGPRRLAVEVGGCTAVRVRNVWPLPARLFAVALGALAVAGCDIPMPDSALLKPQPPPKCDAKADGDYQVQCYRHAEMIARNRLGELQDSVRETVKAVKPSASKPGSGGSP